MGRPADRAKGVILVTDYGALEWALEQKRLQEAKRAEIRAHLEASLEASE